MCPAVETGQLCQAGDICQKAHNRVEQLYRIDTYKTKFCTFYPLNIDQCEYGKYCSFAHSEEDIVIELIHNLEYDEDFFMFYYKTVWCPFNLTSHDKALCVYAHNWQDFRRKPNIYGYQSIACANWKTKDFIQEYSEGCQNSFNCHRCHGWKELEYHPLLFRTKQCLNQICRKVDCSFYHDENDKRIVSELVQRIFKIVPRNRITEETFNEDELMGKNGQISQLDFHSKSEKIIGREFNYEGKSQEEFQNRKSMNVNMNGDRFLQNLKL